MWSKDTFFKYHFAHLWSLSLLYSQASLPSPADGPTTWRAFQVHNKPYSIRSHAKQRRRRTTKRMIIKTNVVIIYYHTVPPPCLHIRQGCCRIFYSACGSSAFAPPSVVSFACPYGSLQYLCTCPRIDLRVGAHELCG